MKSMLGRGNEVGRQGYSHTSSSGGEELEGHGLGKARRERLANKRKAAKLMSAAARVGNARKRLRARTPGESDSSEEEGADEGQDDDEADDVDGSDDEEEPKVFAPSGRTRVGMNSRDSKVKKSVTAKKSSMLKNKTKIKTKTKTPTKIAASRSNGIRGGQTGRVGRSISSRSTQTQTKKRRRTNPKEEEVVEDQDVEDEPASDEAPEAAQVAEAAEEADVDGSADDDSSDDDDIYQVLDYMSDSEEDESDVELIEEAAIIVEETETSINDPLGIGYADFTLDLDISALMEASQNELELTDFTGSMANNQTSNNINWNEPHFVETADVIVPNNAPTSITEAVNSIDSPRPQESQAITGLQTPNSLKRSIELDEDGDETEEEKDNMPSFVNVSNLKFPMGTMPAPPKPRKAKKPKLGSFEISKKEICMYHDDSKKLIMVGGRKVNKSGYNTPKGIIPLDPRKETPPSEVPSTPVQTMLANINTNVMGPISTDYSPFDTPLAASSLGEHDDLTPFGASDPFDSMKGLVSSSIGPMMQTNTAHNTLLTSDFDLFDSFNDFVQL